MVAESLAKQEEEGILCSPTSQIENVNEEEMDTSISHYKRKVRLAPLLLNVPETRNGGSSSSSRSQFRCLQEVFRLSSPSFGGLQ